MLFRRGNKLSWKSSVGYLCLFENIRSAVLISFLNFIGWITKQAIFNSNERFDRFLSPKRMKIYIASRDGIIPNLVLNFPSVVYAKYGASRSLKILSKRRTILKLHGEETNLEEISDGIPFVFETRRAVNEARLPLEFAPGGDGSAILRVVCSPCSRSIRTLPPFPNLCSALSLSLSLGGISTRCLDRRPHRVTHGNNPRRGWIRLPTVTSRVKALRSFVPAAILGCFYGS